MNPYYNADKFNLDLHVLDQPDLSYEFNTLVFFFTEDGRVFSAQDSGCSCPTPFDGYEAANLESLLPQLERVGSVEQAKSIIDAWGHASFDETQEALSRIGAALNRDAAGVAVRPSTS